MCVLFPFSGPLAAMAEIRIDLACAQATDFPPLSMQICFVLLLLLDLFFDYEYSLLATYWYGAISFHQRKSICSPCRVSPQKSAAAKEMYD